MLGIAFISSDNSDFCGFAFLVAASLGLLDSSNRCQIHFVAQAQFNAPSIGQIAPSGLVGAHPDARMGFGVEFLADDFEGQGQARANFKTVMPVNQDFTSKHQPKLRHPQHSLESVNKLVKQAIAGIANAPPVNVVASPINIGIDAPNEVPTDITLRSGAIYVFQSGRSPYGSRVGWHPNPLVFGGCGFCLGLAARREFYDGHLVILQNLTGAS